MVFPLQAIHFLHLNLVKFCYRNCRRSRMVSGLFRRKWAIQSNPLALQTHMLTYRLTTNNYAAACSFGNIIILRTAEVKSKSVHDIPDRSI